MLFLKHYVFICSYGATLSAIETYIGNISSNINEVIRAVLKFLLFFYQKTSHAQKKYQKTPKRTKSTKTSLSKCKKRNKRTKIKNALKKHLRGK